MVIASNKCACIFCGVLSLTALLKMVFSLTGALWICSRKPLAFTLLLHRVRPVVIEGDEILQLSLMDKNMLYICCREGKCSSTGIDSRGKK